MIVTVKKKWLLVCALAAVVIAGLAEVAAIWNKYPVAGINSVYRVFVVGVGTVEGKWCGNTGVAVIKLQTQPARKEGKDLKIVDLLIANRGSESMKFYPDIALVNRRGEQYGLKGNRQPEVVIGPGELSSGTVIIDVPRGIPDDEWHIKISRGNIEGEIILPLRVQVVTGSR